MKPITEIGYWSKKGHTEVTLDPNEHTRTVRKWNIKGGFISEKITKTTKQTERKVDA